MRKTDIAALTLIVTLLGACGDRKPTQVIAEPALQTMEKAQGVQATVDQQKADVDTAVDQANK